jgi:hypothetical protein
MPLVRPLVESRAGAALAGRPQRAEPAPFPEPWTVS